MGMFGWWADLSPSVRYGVSFALMAFGALAFMSGHLRGGAVFCAIGFGLLLFSGPSDSEKKGYRF